MTIFPVIVVTMSSLALLFWILKRCLKWNIFGAAEDKVSSKLTSLQKTKEIEVESSRSEHKSQIDPPEKSQEAKEETSKVSPHLKKKPEPLSTVSTSLEKNELFPGEENEDSSLSEEAIKLFPNVKETLDLPISEQSIPDDLIDEKSLSSDHELELSLSKQSPITTKKTPSVKECSVNVKQLKVPIKECGVFLKKCPTDPTEIPVKENLNPESLLEGKSSSISELETESNNDIVDPNEKAIVDQNDKAIVDSNEKAIVDQNDKASSSRRKPTAVATKDNVAPKSRVKVATEKLTIELPSPISHINNNSATKKKKKLFSLTPQKSEIFSPVEVGSSEVDPRNVVMKQLRERRPKRK